MNEQKIEDRIKWVVELSQKYDPNKGLPPAMYKDGYTHYVYVAKIKVDGDTAQQAGVNALAKAEREGLVDVMVSKIECHYPKKIGFGAIKAVVA